MPTKYDITEGCCRADRLAWWKRFILIRIIFGHLTQFLSNSDKFYCRQSKVGGNHWDCWDAAKQQCKATWIAAIHCRWCCSCVNMAYKNKLKSFSAILGSLSVSFSTFKSASNYKNDQETMIRSGKQRGRKTCCIFWLQNRWNNLRDCTQPECRRLNSFMDGRQNKKSSPFKCELNWFEEKQKQQKLSKSVYKPKLETSLWKTLRLKVNWSEYKEKRRRAFRSLQWELSSQTDWPTELLRQLLIKGGAAAESEKHPSSTSRDAGDS